MSDLEAVRAYAFEPRVPPREFRLWAAGDNPTDYGVHKWTERSVEEVWSRYQARGNLLQLDIEHNCADFDDTPKDPSGVPPTAGYARLEIRAGEPWLVFEDDQGRSLWSAIGAEQIATGQRLNLSGEYQVDRATGEIVGISRVSLVAKPGTHFARLLASGARSTIEPGTVTVRANAGGTMDLAVILAALRAALAAEDPAVCKESITALLAELSKGDGAAPKPAGDAPKPPEGAKADAPPPPAGDAPKPPEGEKKPEPVTASASPELAAAMKRIDDFERDQLLRQFGHRLEESVRAAAVTQSLATVKWLVSVSSEKTATAEVTAGALPRGAGQGKPADDSPHLDVTARAALDAEMGLGRRGPAIAYEKNVLTLGVMTPEQARDHIAAKAKKEAAR